MPSIQFLSLSCFLHSWMVFSSPMLQTSTVSSTPQPALRVLGPNRHPQTRLMGLAYSYDPFSTTPTDRSICQSHGVSGICVESQPVRSFRRAVAMWSRFCRASSVFPLSQRTMAVRAWGSGRSAVCAVRVYSALVLGGGRQKRNRVQMGNTLWLIQLHCCISI